MLSLTGIHKRFFDPGRGAVAALAGVDLSCEGGVLAVVGANGAGKSTLLRIIATLLVPDAGSVRVAGIDAVADPEGARARIGYLATTTRLSPRLTARELLRHVGGCYGLGGGDLERRIAAQVERFAIAPFLDQRLDGLSTGQMQRVNLARTLVADPPVLILDEPTTGLDLVAGRQVIEAVAEARQAGRLILISTHILSDVETVADRLAIVHAGRVTWQGVPGDLGHGADFAAAIHHHVGGGS